MFQAVERLTILTPLYDVVPPAELVDGGDTVLAVGGDTVATDGGVGMEVEGPGRW